MQGIGELTEYNTHLCKFALTDVIVAVDAEVVVCVGRVAGAGFVGFKGSVGDGEVVGVDVLFSFAVRNHTYRVRDIVGGWETAPTVFGV